MTTTPQKQTKHLPIGLGTLSQTSSKILGINADKKEPRLSKLNIVILDVI